MGSTPIRCVQDAFWDPPRDRLLNDCGLTAGVGDAIADDAGHVILGTIGDILAAPILALVASALFFDLGGGAGAPAD
jgi:hypothetical protein